MAIHPNHWAFTPLAFGGLQAYKIQPHCQLISLAFSSHGARATCKLHTLTHRMPVKRPVLRRETSANTSNHHRQSRITHHISRLLGLLPFRLYYGSFHRSSCHKQGVHLPASDSRTQHHCRIGCEAIYYHSMHRHVVQRIQLRIPHRHQRLHFRSCGTVLEQPNSEQSFSSLPHLIAKCGTNVLTTVGGRHSGQQRLSSHMLKQTRGNAPPLTSS
jgi:hypothetical protein